MQKTILITGSTDGIGLATAKELAKQGHSIILHGRSPSKLKTAFDDLLTITTAESLDTVCADLSKLDEVRQLANNINENHALIDILINNAGIFKTSKTTTESGIDVRFVVNTIAPYLLTKLLLPNLSEDGRVINLSSAAQAPVDIDALQGRKSIDDDFSAYAQSKLALTIWSQELAKQLPKADQVMVSVNPGSLLGSKMVKEGFGVAGGDIGIGADILSRAALSDEFINASGKYFDNDVGHFNSPHDFANNSENCTAVMQILSAIK